MTVVDDLVALSNMSAVWGLQLNGTDATANTLNLTISGTGTSFGGSIVTGLSQSLVYDGSAAAAASRASGASSGPFDAPSEFSTGGFMRLAGAPSANGHLVQRQSTQWDMQLLTTRIPRCFVTASGGSSGYAQTVLGQMTPPIGETVWIAMDWQNNSLFLSMNGVLIAQQEYEGTIAFASGSAVNLFNNIPGAFACWYFRKQAIGLDTHRDIATSYLPVAPPTFASFTSFGAPAGALENSDSPHGGKVHGLDAKVVRSGGTVWRGDLYGAYGRHLPGRRSTFPVPSRDVPDMAAKCLLGNLNLLTQRSVSTDPVYHDGTFFVNSLDTALHRNMGVMPGIAQLITGRGVQGAGDRLMAFLLSIGEYALSQQDATTGDFAPFASGANGVFVTGDFVKTLSLVGHLMDAATYDRWLERTLLAISFFVRGNELAWYTNGNVELHGAEMLYRLWTITGDAAHKAWFDYQWAWALDPAGTLGAPLTGGNGLPIGGGTYGLKGSTGGALSQAAMMALSPTSGTAFFGESAGTGAPGFDRSYTNVQMFRAWELYEISGDPVHLQLLNVLLNAVLAAGALDTGAWVLTVNGSLPGNLTGPGTRHSGTESWLNNVAAWLTWRDLRADITHDFASQMTTASGVIPSFRSNFYSGNFTRGIDTLGSWVRSAV